MPSLEWIGKEKVVNHHLEVPYHVLERQYSYDEDGQKVEDNGSENMIIHGDNLLALKSLLPKYEGRISCIYIDPPYNTGNEGWVYNDNVKDPRIENWLGEVVGKEGDDLSRHDKWLCMMYPRLKLLQRLLADDGFIAVSVDDNEILNLGLIMDEIFGVNNRMACAPVRSEPSGGKKKTALRTGHEYILFYGKTAETNLALEGKSGGNLNLSDKWGKYRKGRELRKWGATSDRSDRPNLWFGITTPDGKVVYPVKNNGKDGYWRWGKENSFMKKILEDPSAAHWEKCSYDEGITVCGQHERWVPFEKIRDEEKFFGWNTWLDGYGTNADATSVIKSIFGDKIFDTPKPLSLIQWIISLYDSKNSIVLDSFSGSGTTAHAVLDMNAKDGGHRHFILVEMEDYADSITAERVKRVIYGYPTNKKDMLYDAAITTKNIKDGGDLFAEAKEIADDAKDSYDKVEGPKMVDGHLQVIGIEKAKEHQKGTGGNFSFYELGEPLFHGELLNEEVTIDTIREYIYFMETRQSLSEEKADEPYYLGSYVGTAYYFCYEKDEATTLNREFLHTVKTKDDYYVIYADRCTLSDAELAKFQITFKKIPRDIARL